ncbi:iron hydrogenase [Polychaeton citri CBS 116435]|uniref:Nuclear architecture-related protein 1 n=1 Tax=Polychaeton citri CBS 116435 TaxID=1314669 RepID=A0A9P4Q3P4_9PEZI|nr:iron hydrogenase [Polychaeton citri CBS 116435]
MSAILSVDDLNDFISPGVACIKPVETLPRQRPPPENAHNEENRYEVTTEERAQPDEGASPAQISLTDCLACSGCVTSAEAVLVSLQSHNEVLDTLDKYPSLQLSPPDGTNGRSDGKIFVASVSPQARASLAATYNVSEHEAGLMVQQLLAGPQGVCTGGRQGSSFAWIVDTNKMRNVCLAAAADEVCEAVTAPQPEHKKPVLTSACPGWICYAEKTHPHILPHLSRLKSPQALTGTLLKSVLAKQYGITPDRVWHLAVMPCFDKKLEASRSELTSEHWRDDDAGSVRDVDCVITARELLMLAESRGISFPALPRRPIELASQQPFPDMKLDRFLFEPHRGIKRKRTLGNGESTGTSGGYLRHVMMKQQSLHPGSTIEVHRGRNSDVCDYTLTSPEGTEIFRAARYYGFRNIQNLVRKLKPVKISKVTGAARRPGGSRRPGGAASKDERQYQYVEVMACPGGCTNGGGQVKVGDVLTLRQVGGTGVVNGSSDQQVLPQQKEWLAMVDEAYWSAESGSDADEEIPQTMDECGLQGSVIDGVDHQVVDDLVRHWASLTGIEASKLLYTSFRAVDSDVGKEAAKTNDVTKVAGLAAAAGGGW